MKVRITSILLLVFMGLLSSNAVSETWTGMPLKYISSCELDFNSDDEPDVALLVETIKNRELIVLIRTMDGYNTYLVSQGKSDMHLSCHFGKSIKNVKGKVYRTSGTYIQLTLPEGSTVVYFWNKNKFQEVWTGN